MSDIFDLACPECGIVRKAKQEQVGRKVKCSCGFSFEVPNPQRTPTEIAVAPLPVLEALTVDEEVGEIRFRLRQLRLRRKQFRHVKKINLQNQRVIRAEYTAYTRTRLPKFPGGGKLGFAIRVFQTLSRDDVRYQLAQELDPLLAEQAQLEAAIELIEREILILEERLLEIM